MSKRSRAEVDEVASIGPIFRAAAATLLLEHRTQKLAIRMGCTVAEAEEITLRLHLETRWSAGSIPFRSLDALEHKLGTRPPWTPADLLCALLNVGLLQVDASDLLRGPLPTPMG